MGSQDRSVVTSDWLSDPSSDLDFAGVVVPDQRRKPL